jgi:hypothetical protein
LPIDSSLVVTAYSWVAKRAQIWRNNRKIGAARDDQRQIRRLDRRWTNVRFKVSPVGNDSVEWATLGVTDG